jgi:hypothetical protein
VAVVGRVLVEARQQLAAALDRAELVVALGPRRRGAGENGEGQGEDGPRPAPALAPPDPVCYHQIKFRR